MSDRNFDGNVKCKKCGSPLNQSQQVTSKLFVSSTQDHTRKYAIAIAVAIALIISSFFAYRQYEASRLHSEKNQKALKDALNAIGEINSIATVGANYMDYNQALQTAKVKFDISLRDFESLTEKDRQTLINLNDCFEEFVEAREVWGEFVKDGDQFGFFDARDYSMTEQLALKYGYTKGEYDYYRDQALRIILTKASQDFSAIESEKLFKP